jgi:hypothetical protein
LLYGGRSTSDTAGTLCAIPFELIDKKETLCYYYNMIVNHYNNSKEHPGNQPIRVLRHNIVKSFQEYNPIFINEFPLLNSQGYLTNNINYIINDLPIFYDNQCQIPYIENGTIHLHEIFLAYLWSICFGIHTPFYKTVHEKIIFEQDKILFDECNEQMKFAHMIKTEYKLLDKYHRYNPELFEESNCKIIGITNAMYINALNFILAHEYSHAKYCLFHGTKEDEKRADYEATQLLVKGSKNDNDFGNKAIAGLMGLGANMLLNKFIQSVDHLDTDRRIFDYIENIGITDENNEIWALACLIYAYWDYEYDIKLDFFQGDLFLTYKQRFINLIKQ